MWKIVSFIIEALVIVIVFSQVLLPLILDKPLFWMFRKKKQAPETADSKQSPTLKKEVEEVVKKVEKVNEKVDEHYSEAKDLKDKMKNI